MNRQSGLKVNKKRVQSVNAKILNMEKRYGKDSQIVQRVYHTLNKAMGTEGKTRYTYKGVVSLRKFNMIDRGLSLVENSLYASAEGRKKLRQKTRDVFKKTYSEIDTERMFDFFENSTNWDRIRDLSGKGGGSPVYVDAIDRALERGEDSKSIDDLFESWARVQGIPENWFAKNHRRKPKDDFIAHMNSLKKTTSFENEAKRLDKLYDEFEKFNGK